MSVVSTDPAGAPKVLASNFITVTNVNSSGGDTTVTLSSAITLPVAGDIFTFLISTMTNQSSSPTWPGDPDYLEGRYVRFSYRYTYTDSTT